LNHTPIPHVNSLPSKLIDGKGRDSSGVIQVLPMTSIWWKDIANTLSRDVSDQAPFQTLW
jgi:hypothetical protein